MTFTFDAAPRVFLVLGVLLLCVAGILYRQGDVALVPAVIGCLFIVVAIATALGPKRPSG